MVIDALDAFGSQIAAVSWTAIAIAVLFHLVRLAARVRAWQNIVAAAYPGTRVPYWSTFGSYVAGVGVNAIAPARAGDVLKLYLLKHRVEGATYPTLASTLVVETLFDFAVATVLLLAAIALGLLPGLPDIPALPAFDWAFVVENPRVAAIGASVLAAALILGIAWASTHVRSFWDQVREGFVILGEPRVYLAGVVSWQALSWGARFATVYFFLRAFHIDATLETALAVIVVQSLATLLPVTPGGVGPQQALLVYVLRGSAPAGAVISFSIGMHVVVTLANVVVGFVAIGLMLRTFRWRSHVSADQDLVKAAEQAAEPSGTGAPG
jgi:uncharacterized membrane protein YbhN (UPF0104 family)